MKYSSLFALCLSVGLSSCVIHINDDGWYTGSWDDHDGPRLEGNGVVAHEVRDSASFDSIALEDGVDLEARIGDETSVAVHTDDNIVKHVRTRVEGNTLRVSLDPGRYSPRKGLKVVVTSPTLLGVSIEGSSDVDLEGLTGPAFAVSIEGSGDLRGSGEVERLDIAIEGSGDVRLYDLVTQRASISISGSGDVYATVHGDLEASIAGSGDIHYRGKPACRLSVSGSGSIHQADSD